MLAGGCATASRGTTQAIKIGSQPDGAACELSRDGKSLGSVTTPGSITVSRERQPITVVCTKAGHDDARAVLNSLTTEPLVVAGAGIIGGIIAAGALVDMASGANHHYQSAVMVKLEPLSPADEAAAAAPPSNSAPTAPSPAPANVAAAPLTDSSAVAAAMPLPARPVGRLPAAGTWDCGIKGISRSYKLQFLVAADRSMVVASYANAPVTVVKTDPLTVTALNPRGARPMNIVWNADNTMVITGPTTSGNGTFRDEGACTKV
jgi:hypothetical protein